MYQYSHAVLLPKGKNKTWGPHDVSLLTMSQLFSNFHSGFIVLTETLTGATPLYLDYQLLKQLTVPYHDMAFEIWILTLSAGDLPTSLVEPIITRNNILYSDAIQAQYTITRSNSDVLLHKDNISTTDLFTRVLTSVNGVLHRNAPADDEESLKILDGAVVSPRPYHNSVGLYSFVNVGNVEQIPITLDMIHNVNTATKRYQTVLIKTNIDATNKSVMLSIAGYLHAMDTTYDIISQNPCIIILRTNRIDFVTRLFELADHTPLTQLGLSQSTYAPDAIAVKELTEDAFINNVLTMIQSFIIVVDAPNVYVEKQLAIRPPHVGFYESLVEPLFPLLTETGREMIYWRRKQIDRWVVNIPPQYHPNYLIHTTDYQQGRSVNRTLSEDGYSIPNAYFLGIYSAVKA